MATEANRAEIVRVGIALGLLIARLIAAVAKCIDVAQEMPYVRCAPAVWPLKFGDENVVVIDSASVESSPEYARNRALRNVGESHRLQQVCNR